jgi:predicted DNA-binding protein
MVGGVYTEHMIRVNIHLTEKQRETLRNLARATGLSVAEHIRRAIDEYLRRVDERIS